MEETELLVASLPNLHNVRRKFPTARKERCGRGYGLVHVNLCCPMPWGLERDYIYVRELSNNISCELNLHSGHRTRISHGGWLLIGPTHNCQNWGVGACTETNACSGQYGTRIYLMFENHWWGMLRLAPITKFFFVVVAVA